MDLEKREEQDPLLEEVVPEYLKEEQQVLFEWLCFISIIISLICSIRLPYLREKKFCEIDLWQWEVLALVVICGRLLSVWIFKIIIFSLERNLLFRKRVSYFIYELRKNIQNCLWSGLILVVWLYLFDENIAKEIHNKVLSIVAKLLASLVVGVTVWLVKIVLVNVVESNFYRSAYFKSILDSIFKQYIIEALSGQPLIEIQRIEEERTNASQVRNLPNVGATIPPTLGGPSPYLTAEKNFKKGDKKDEGIISLDLLHKLKPENVSVWNLKSLMKIIKHDSLCMLEQIQDGNSRGELTQITTEREAKIAARKIFWNVATPGSTYIFLEDIRRFMREVEALRAQSLLNGGFESQNISLPDLKNWVVKAVKERRALSLTLNDSKKITSRLNKVFNFLVSIIILVIWLVVLEIKTSKFSNYVLVFASPLLPLSFIYGDTLKRLLEAILFLVSHPFDVGDSCEIEGAQMVVEEIKILNTIFLKESNKRITMSNSALTTKPIINNNRSPDMEDQIEFCVHMGTSTKKIPVMKEKIKGYINSKKKHWYPEPKIICTGIEDLDRLKYKVFLKHRTSHQDLNKRLERKGRVLEEIDKILRELNINKLS